MRLAIVIGLLVFVILGCGGGGGFAGSGSITLNPPESSLQPGGSRQFTVIEGVLVDWSAPDGGTVSANGLFTAPNTTGTFRVIATGFLNPTLSDTAEVTVANVQVEVSPAAISVAQGSVTPNAFKAFVTGNANHSVTWSATGGTVVASTPDPSGNPRADFTAGTTPGNFLVRATSVADNSVSGIAQVTVLGASSLALNPRSAAANATIPTNSVTLVAVMTDASGNVDDTTPLIWEVPINPVGATLTGAALRQRTFTVPTTFSGTAICQVRVRTGSGVSATSTIQVSTN